MTNGLTPKSKVTVDDLYGCLPAAKPNPGEEMLREAAEKEAGPEVMNRDGDQNARPCSDS